MQPNTTTKKTLSGTQSPPLEATGSAKPMGVSSIDGTQKGGYVLDAEQRKEYFGASDEQQASKKPEARQTRKVGQSLAQQVEEERT
ncbi:hypothetical protein NLJ89_g3335 [Agrocybe chaxingu]|uniref:Uncharacterized protein n=1 Tax=Agrocybe chaxingu TaxID=84603 RepID=A0A9W8K4T7_9AGAR|nr:hypothetical protein NLJ89_g3335 [Agrocybe chaxingu]